MVYRFGEFEYDPDKLLLLRNGKKLEESLTRIELSILNKLLERASADSANGLEMDRSFDPGDLRDAVWGKGLGSNERLATHVSALRRKLGKRPDGDWYIPHRTYAIAVKVERLDESPRELISWF